MILLKPYNTFSASIKIPKIVLQIASILAFFSHRLIVIVATKIFTTPPKFITPKRELVMLNSSQKSFLKVEKIDKEIEILSYGFSKKKVLLAHGWAGRSTHLFAFAHKLLEKGFMVISFNAPAHGKSTGKTTNLIEYIESIKAINEEFGPFEAAIGHSFGSVALLNIASEKQIFKSIVTIGAADQISTIIENFIKSLHLKPIIAEKMKTHIQKKWNIILDDFSSSKVAQKIKIPVLVIHDINDGDVAVSCAQKIRQNLEKGSLLITNNLGHTKILRDNETVKKVVSFIIKKEKK